MRDENGDERWALRDVGASRRFCCLVCLGAASGATPGVVLRCVRGLAAPGVCLKYEMSSWSPRSPAKHLRRT